MPHLEIAVSRTPSGHRSTSAPVCYLCKSWPCQCAEVELPICSWPNGLLFDVLCACRAALEESRINAAQAVEKHARRALRQTLMKAAMGHASERPTHALASAP